MFNTYNKKGVDIMRKSPPIDTARGNRIKHLRIEADLTQQELADRCGFSSKASISRLEQGVGIIDVDVLNNMAKALHTSPEYIMNGISTAPVNSDDLSSAPKILGYTIYSGVNNSSDNIVITPEMIRSLSNDDMMRLIQIYNKCIANYKRLAEEYLKKEGDSE